MTDQVVFVQFFITTYTPKFVLLLCSVHISYDFYLYDHYV